jgi:hypothetical protein
MKMERLDSCLSLDHIKKSKELKRLKKRVETLHDAAQIIQQISC